MGTWNVGIYENDIAMDTICIIEEQYKELGIEGALENFKINNLYNYNESKLAIAGVELFIYGTVKNAKQIVKVINEELSYLIDWDKNDRTKRHDILVKLEEEILNKKTNNYQMPNDLQIKRWFKDVHSKDIL